MREMWYFRRVYKSCDVSKYRSGNSIFRNVLQNVRGAELYVTIRLVVDCRKMFETE